MSYTSEYLKLRNKRLKEQEQKVDSSMKGKRDESYTEEYLRLRESTLAQSSFLSDQFAPSIYTSPREDEDIAPVKMVGSGVVIKNEGAMLTSAYKPTTDSAKALSAKAGEDVDEKAFADFIKKKAEEEEEKAKEEAEGLKFFKESEGDVAQAILGTLGDAGLGIVKGVGNFSEGIADALFYGIADAHEMFGASKLTVAGMRSEAAKNTFDGWLEPATDYVDKYSVLDRTSDAVAQGIGQAAIMFGLGAGGQAFGWGSTAVTALTTGTTAVSGYGSGIGEALNSGATIEDARTYGLISGAAEAGTELIFGGMGKGVNALGYNKGLLGADDLLAKKLTSKIQNTLVKNVAQGTIKAGGEGFEEVLAGGLQAMGKKLTYMSEEDIGKIIEDENLLEQFVVGAFVSGTTQTPSVIKSTNAGQDYITGITKSEQLVVDEVVKDRIAQEEQEGKVTNKRKGEIEQEVVREMEKGYLDIGTIESILGGSDYKSYKDTVDSEEALKKELSDLQGMKYGDMTDIQHTRLAELKEMDFSDTSKRDSLKAKLDERLDTMLKGSRLTESYREAARVGEAFKADFDKYKGAKHEDAVRQTLENAEKSGANNTNRFHELADLAAQISADTGLVFDFTGNDEIKAVFTERQQAEIAKLESIPEAQRTKAQTEHLAKLKDQLAKVQSGEITVNGDITGKGIVLNLDSGNPLNRIVGHEVTHSVEKAKHYEALRDAIFEYAKAKGVDVDGELAKRNALYEGVQGANAEGELVADLVGDYLFSDSGFVENLAVTKRNVFQKIYDEIKYLYRIATAGSKEARALEKVKREFDRVYRESVQAENVRGNDVTGNATVEVSASNVQYSLRQEAPPKKTVEVYKLMRLQDGEIYPLFIDSTEPLKVGEWYNADSPNMDFLRELPSGVFLVDANTGTYQTFDEYLQENGGRKTKFPSKKAVEQATADGKRWVYIEDTESGQRRFGGETRKYWNIGINGSGTVSTFSMRPGYHAGSLPTMRQIGKGKNRDLRDDSFVWTVGEVPADIEYQAEADQNPDKDIPTHIPVDGYYLKATNADKVKSQADRVGWYVAGAYKINRIISDSEARQVIDNWNKEHPDTPVEYDYDRESGMDFDADQMTLVPRGDVKYSLSADSEGRQLSKEQVDYFSDSKIVDENGNLKVMYHGSNESFTVFDRKKARASGYYGSGFYFTDSPSHAQQYGNVYGVYLNITNPLRDGTQNITKDQLRNFVEAVAENEDYGIENYGYGATVDSVVDSVYGKGDFAMLMDINASCIGNFVEAVELFNEVNGTDYNGVLAPTETVAFYPNQIKSVDNDSPTSDSDIRYSLSADTQKTDDEYQKAVESGDMETAQKMVDEAAKKAGYNIKAYHGTNAKFNAFKQGEKNGWLGKGIYFTENKGYARENGKKVISAYLAGKNLYESTHIDHFGVFSELKSKFPNLNEINIAEVLKSEGYEGITYTDWDKGKIISVFSPDQIKSADPVTYDDSGNVIPLSKRFDAAQDDIRFSLSQKGEQFAPTTGYDIFGKDVKIPQEAVQESAPVQESVTDDIAPIVYDGNSLEEQIYEAEKLVDDLTQGFYDLISKQTSGELADAEFEKLFTEQTEKYERAKQEYDSLLAQAKETDDARFGSLEDADVPPEMDAPFYGDRQSVSIEDADVKTLAREIGNYYGIPRKQRGELSQIVSRYAEDGTVTREQLFSDVKKAIGTFDTELPDLQVIKDAKQYLRQTPIKVGKERGDIADYGDFVRRNFGKIRFSNTGLEVDVAYISLNEAYPDLFPESISNPSDQLLRMEEVANMATKMTEHRQDGELMAVVDDIVRRVSEYKEQKINEQSLESLDQFMEVADDYAPVDENAPVRKTAPVEAEPIQTVDEKIATKIRNLQTEIANLQREQAKSNADFDAEIARLYAEYNGKKNKNTAVANGILRSAERLKRIRNNVDAEYASKIERLSESVHKMNKPEYKRAAHRMEKYDQYTEESSDLMGDTSTWRDKKLGISYQTNTLHRNLRDVVRDADGKRDIARADRIYEYLQGTYNENEAALKRESRKIKQQFADMKINKYESEYIQMLGEFRYSPDSELSQEDVSKYLEKHKRHIDTEKVETALAESRKVYDSLIERVNAVLREQGMKEIAYRKGYFHHFTDPKQGWLAKLLNWKVRDDSIPTDIAGLTETFNPVRTYQSFDKRRTTDDTDYNFLRGFDTYVHGALDWIYHIEDIQRRRAFENEIRYRHSEQGIRDRVREVWANTELDADEAQAMIEAIYADAKNPLNNFVTDFRNGTNNLAGKKSTADRGLEYATNRKVYSTMTNISNRVSANMIAGSISSALTNFIPITQSWGQVNPVYSLISVGDVVRNAFRDDGMINKSTFMTNRLMEEENLDRGFWDKTSDVLGFMMDTVDKFTTQVVWRSKYRQNLAKGMSENEAIHDADVFAENVMAGRSRGNMPTIFNSKNIVTKVFTAFQLEVANQYGYMFKDMPQDVGQKNIAKLAKGYALMYVGAYVYNEMFSALTGRSAAFDPIRIIEELLRDLGFGDDDEEEVDVKGAVLGLGENVAQELPYVGGLLGGGRVPISSALPYDMNVEDFLTDAFGMFESEDRDKYVKGFTNEMLKPLLYLASPMGGGQIKKTYQGLSMFSDEHPISGSYTDSGDLRFPVEETPWNVTQAALFGQYASENAREYFDEGYAPLKENQVEEFADVDMTFTDYHKYRDGLSKLTKNEEKFAYIRSQNLPDWKKNILLSNVVDVDARKDNFLKTNGISYLDYTASEDSKKAYDWAFDNPDKFEVAKAVAGDAVTYRQYTDAISDIPSDKDEYGNSISGSKKEKVIQYINSLDLDYGARIILFKSQYKKDDTYNYDIVEYLNSRDDISYEEMKTILTELDFVVDQNGNIYWD